MRKNASCTRARDLAIVNFCFWPGMQQHESGSTHRAASVVRGEDAGREWPVLVIRDEIRVDLPTLPAAVAWTLAAAASPDRRCRQVVATGFHGIWSALGDPVLRRRLEGRALWLPDGIAPVRMARALGYREAVRVPGADFLASVLRAPVGERPLRHYFLGDTAATLTALAAHVERDCPGHEVAGTFSPPMQAEWGVPTPGLVARVNAAAPDVLWVGLGTPKQDAWIAANREALEVPVAVGVGAAFRFEAGSLARCPAWLGDAGLEWLFRLAVQPRRLWRRYLVEGPRFAAAAWRAHARGELRLERPSEF